MFQMVFMVINKVRGLLFTTPTMLGPPSIPVLPYHLYRIVVIEWFWTRIQLVQIRTKLLIGKKITRVRINLGQTWAKGGHYTGAK